MSYTYLFSYFACTRKNGYDQQVRGYSINTFKTKVTIDEINNVIDSICKNQKVENVVITSINPIEGETLEIEDPGFYVVSITSVNDNTIKTFLFLDDAKRFIEEIAKKCNTSLEEKDNIISHNWWHFYTDGVLTEYRIHYVKKIGED